MVNNALNNIANIMSFAGFWPIVDLSLSTGVDYMRTCSEELFGRDIGPETPQSIALLVKHLAYMLPAVRLNDQLSRVGSHQKIVDYFAAKGPHIKVVALAALRRIPLPQVA